MLSLFASASSLPLPTLPSPLGGVEVPALTVQFLQLLGFFSALIISLLVVPAITAWATQAGLLDEPGGRKIHAQAIPRFGGVGIFLGWLLGLGVVCYSYGQYPAWHTGATGMLVGGILMFLLGLADDKWNLSPYVKLGGQFLAAFVAYKLGVQITALDLPWAVWIKLNALSMPITMLWLVGIANAVNFIDGLDGLAGGVSTLSALTLAVVAVFTNQPLAAIMAALLAGSSLGFLVYNTHPAKIFMGDSGSLFIGFMLAAIAITGVLKTQIAVMLVPMVILSVPILDIVYSTGRRLLAGKSPFVADASHLHHRLLQSGMTQIGAVSVIYGVCIMSGMLATSYVHDLESYLVLLAGMALLWFALVTLRFSVQSSNS